MGKVLFHTLLGIFSGGIWFVILGVRVALKILSR